MRLANKLIFPAWLVAVILFLVMATGMAFLLRGLETRNRASIQRVTQELAMEKPDSEFVRELQDTQEYFIREIRFMTAIVFVAGSGAMLVFLVFLISLTRCALKPLAETAEFAATLARGDLSADLRLTVQDEIAGIARSLSALRNRLEQSMSKLKMFHMRENSEKSANENANTRKSDFVSSIAHELKNPLNSILGICALMGKRTEPGVPDPELDAKVQVVMNSAESINEHVSMLLEISRFDGTPHPLHPSPIDTSELLRELIESCLEAAERKSISIVNHHSATTPKTLQCDQAILEKILRRLLINAIDVSGAGCSVDIGCDRQEDGFAFWIRDHAQILSGSLSLAQIFKQSGIRKKSSHSIQTHQGAPYLNMTLASLNAEVIGAHIAAESDESGNSTFRIVVPNICLQAPGTDLETEKKSTLTATNVISIEPDGSFRVRTAPEGKKQRAPGEPIQILMAEDSEANRMLVELVFRNSGHYLECVEDGKVCMDVLKRKKFDILLLDLQMPRLDGYDVLKQIRENREWDEMPIIVLTAYMEEGDFERLITAGANDCIEKPIQIDELVKKVNAYA